MPGREKRKETESGEKRIRHIRGKIIASLSGEAFSYVADEFRRGRKPVLPGEKGKGAARKGIREMGR